MILTDAEIERWIDEDVLLAGDKTRVRRCSYQLTPVCFCKDKEFQKPGDVRVRSGQSVKIIVAEALSCCKKPMVTFAIGEELAAKGFALRDQRSVEDYPFLNCVLSYHGGEARELGLDECRIFALFEVENEEAGRCGEKDIVGKNPIHKTYKSSQKLYLGVATRFALIGLIWALLVCGTYLATIAIEPSLAEQLAIGPSVALLLIFASIISAFLFSAKEIRNSTK